MELIGLVFMGLSYTLFTNSYSNLIMYFLIQTFSSFCFLVFYLYGYMTLFTISFLLKLSIFPFHFWFIGVTYRFPNFLLWIVSTVHKLPSFLIVSMFGIALDPSLL
jgi:NADH:ubiquinone oxidoreductase subunit 2 (subunit N)